MKRMFGRVVQAEQNKRRNQRSGTGIRHKSTWLVNPKENWPPISKSGVYMNLVQQHSADTLTKKAGNEKNVLYFAVSS